MSRIKYKALSAVLFASTFLYASEYAKIKWERIKLFSSDSSLENTHPSESLPGFEGTYLQSNLGKSIEWKNKKGITFLNKLGSTTTSLFGEQAEEGVVGYEWCNIVENRFQKADLCVYQGRNGPFKIALTYSPTGTSIKKVFIFHNKLIIESTDGVFVNGDNLAMALKAKKSFEVAIFRDSFFYMVEFDDNISAYFGGKKIIHEFSEVYHHQCCGASMYNPKYYGNGMEFYAVKDNFWYKYRVVAFENNSNPQRLKK